MTRLRSGDDVHTKSEGFDSSETGKAAKSLLNEMAMRFRDQPDNYRMFCLSLNDFTHRRLDVETFGLKVKKLLEGHRDLIPKFNAFMPDGYKLNLNYDDDNEDDDEITLDEDSGTEHHDDHGDDGGVDHDNCGDDNHDAGVDNDVGGGGKFLSTMNFVNKVKIRFQNNEKVYAKFLQIINKHQEGRRLHELKNKVAALFHEHSDLFEEFDGIISDSKLVPYSAAKIREQKHMVQSIQEIDLSKCKQVSPSYWLLPKNYCTPLASQRSGIAAEVLNDNLVCTSANSGDYSFNPRRRRPEEEILFQCEDDRFELDMLKEYIISAAKRVEKLMNKIYDNENNGESSSIEIKGHLRVSDLRCIERLYGDYGPDAIENLHRDPKTALPVILNRLKQKQEDLVMGHQEFNKVWAQVSAENHYKLQDKQRESKNLRTEDLGVADEHFKEIEERMQKEDDVILDISGNKQPTFPNSEFQPTHTDMQED